LSGLVGGVTGLNTKSGTNTKNEMAKKLSELNKDTILYFTSMYIRNR
jgi:hypothetical protein